MYVHIFRVEKGQYSHRGIVNGRTSFVRLKFVWRSSHAELEEGTLRMVLIYWVIDSDWQFNSRELFWHVDIA